MTEETEGEHEAATATLRLWSPTFLTCGAGIVRESNARDRNLIGEGKNVPNLAQSSLAVAKEQSGPALEDIRGVSAR